MCWFVLSLFFYIIYFRLVIKGCLVMIGFIIGYKFKLGFMLFKNVILVLKVLCYRIVFSLFSNFKIVVI